MTRERVRTRCRVLVLAAAGLWFWPAAASAAGVCTILIGQSGTMIPSPMLNTMSSTQAGGNRGTASVATNGLPGCNRNHLDRCLRVSVSGPLNFDISPSGGNDNVAFTVLHGLDGQAVAIPGGTGTYVLDGLHVVAIDLTATKTAGLFAAGTYRATTTVLCE